MKVLGVLAMIDDGELDWKVVAVARGDPLFDLLHDVKDVKRLCPGYISGEGRGGVSFELFFCTFCLNNSVPYQV